MFEEEYRKLVWHDMPIAEFCIKNEKKSLELVITPFNESKDDYDYYRLIFSDILEIKFAEGSCLEALFEFDADYATDIFYYDLEIEDGFYFNKLYVTTGFGKGAFLIEIKNKTNELFAIADSK